MESSVIIREAGLADVATVLALWDAAYVDSMRSGAQDIPTLLRHGPQARLTIAEIDGDMAGTLITTFDGWRGNMYRLAVHPDFQRRGIARRLVEDAHAWFKPGFQGANHGRLPHVRMALPDPR